jgi:hypothetical protein
MCNLKPYMLMGHVYIGDGDLPREWPLCYNTCNTTRGDKGSDMRSA